MSARTSVRTSVALAALVLLLSGCTGGASDQAASSGGGDSAAAEGGGAEVAQPAAAPAGAPPAAQEPLQGRSLVRTARVGVRVDDVRAAADRAAGVARAAGGVLAAEQTGDGRATLQLKVPPGRLDDAVAQVGRLGTETGRDLSTEDVTEQVVDLDSRLATQRASLARVRALLDRATGLGDVVKIEGELAKREAELESLDARRRALGARVDLATLVVELEQREQTAAAAVAPDGFRSGLDAGWTAFTTSARALAAVTGAVLPFLPVLLLLAVAERWRRRRGTPAGPPTAGTA